MFALHRSSEQEHRSKKRLFALTNLTLHTLLLTARASAETQALDNTYLSSESTITTYEKIVGGDTAPPGRFPYTCSLRERGTHRHMCGATLFRRDWVLTAAHCVDVNSRAAIGLLPIVYCGIRHRKKAEDDQVFDSVAGYIHPEWTGGATHGHDVAILKLDRDANLTLPRLGTGNFALDKGRLLAATGWGHTDSGVPAKNLQVTTKLAVVGQDKCKTQPQGVDAKSWICAGGLLEDTCKGDSGGPLLLMDAPYGQMEDGKPQRDMIVGITSFGYTEDDAEPCSGIEPAIYTSVDYFLEWIERTINCHQEHSSCVVTHQIKLMEKKKLYATFSESKMIEEMLRAIRTDNSLDAEALILAGLCVNTTYGKKNDPSLPKPDRSTLLHAAVALNAVHCTEVLIKHKAGIEIRNVDGETAMHLTASHDSVAVAKMLLHHGADPNTSSRYAWTPILHAVNHRRVQLVKLLVAHGADVNAVNNVCWTPLFVAADKGYTAVVKILLDAGAEVDVFDEKNWTPLQKAANHGLIQITKMLIEAGANINTASDGGWTPLHETAYHAHIEIQKILLEHGADTEAFTSGDAMTPLHIAAYHGKLQMAKMLVAAGADKTSTDRGDKIPFERVCENRNAKCSEKTRVALKELLRV